MSGNKMASNCIDQPTLFDNNFNTDFTKFSKLFFVVVTIELKDMCTTKIDI
jgi:hypothetical protein